MPPMASCGRRLNNYWSTRTYVSLNVILAFVCRRPVLPLRGDGGGIPDFVLNSALLKIVGERDPSRPSQAVVWKTFEYYYQVKLFFIGLI